MQRLEVVGAEERELPGVEAPREAGEGGAEREALELDGERVLAERGCGVLVVANRLEQAAPRRPHGELGQREEGEGDRPDDEQHHDVLVRDPEPAAEPGGEAHPLAVVLGGLVDPAERDRALRAARQPVLVGGDVADDLPEGDRDDREVVGSQAERRQPDEDPGEPRCDDAEEGGEPHRHPLLHGEDRHRVRADRHEPDLPEVEQAGEAELDLQTEREQRVDAGHDADEGPEVAADDRAHAVRALPKRPCGRRRRATISRAKATTGL